MIPALLALVLAEGGAPVDSELHGDVKTFFVAGFPYDSALLPDDPYGQSTLDGRLKIRLSLDDRVRFDLHEEITAITGGEASTGIGAGVGGEAPEAVDLSWTLTDADLVVKTRIDRAALALSVPGVDVTLGRQPVSFGTGLFFSPMDLVNPFHPATIDQEYKPGVDAARVDVYAGMSGRVSVVAAYAGDWEADGMIYAAQGQATVGVTDLMLFLGEVHGDEVVGVGVASSAGPVGLHGDGTLTIPDGGAIDDIFARVVVGADWRPTGTTTLSGEAYFQSLGETDPEDYLFAYLGERYARGELWAVGRTYAGLACSQEITPLIAASLAIIANVEDPSALIAPSLSWSVAGNASLGAGAYVGVGARPEPATLGGVDFAVLQSEFGVIPVTAFASLRAYF